MALALGVLPALMNLSAAAHQKQERWHRQKHCSHPKLLSYLLPASVDSCEPCLFLGLFKDVDKGPWVHTVPNDKIVMDDKLESLYKEASSLYYDTNFTRIARYLNPVSKDIVTTGAVALGPPQNRNRTPRFCWNSCFSQITKNWFVFLFIRSNEKYNLNLLLLIGASTLWLLPWGPPPF
jgi:hypothetical protein